MNRPPVLLEDQSFQPLRALYFQLGLTLVRRDQHAEALTFLEHALVEPGPQPPDWQVHYLLGLVHEALGDPLAALRAYTAAVADAPARADTLLPYAQDLLTRPIAATEGPGLLSAWAASLGYAHQTADDKAEIDFFLGRLHFYLERPAEALRLFRRAARLRPGDARIHEGLGAALQSLGRLEEASAALQQADSLAQNGSHPERLPRINLRLARILLSAGQHQLALQRISGLVASEHLPDSQLLQMQGACYLALGQPDQARQVAEQLIERERASLPYVILLIQAHTALHAYARALQLLEQALQTNPGDPDLSFLRIQALLESGQDIEDASRLLQRYVKRFGFSALQERQSSDALVARRTDPNALFFLAYIHFHFHPNWSLKLALQEVEQALDGSFAAGETSPEPHALRLKGEILARLKRRREAGQAFFGAGLFYYRASQFDPACELFTRASQEDPRQVKTYWYLADTLRIQSTTDTPPYVKPEIARQALEVWQRGAFQNPDNPDVSWAYLVREGIANQLGQIPGEPANSHWYTALLSIDRALLWLQSAERWARLSSYYRSLALYANTMYTAKQSLAMDADNLEVVENYAGALVDSGELELAEEVFNRLMSLLDQKQPEVKPFYQGWQALAQYFSGQYEAALASIQARLNRYPNEVWSRGLRGYIYRQLGRLDDERADNEFILSCKGKPEMGADAISLGLAAYNLGRIDEAEAFANDPSVETSSGEIQYFILGLCALRRGDVQQARQQLLESLHWSPNKRIVQDVRLDVLALEQRAQAESWPNAGQISAFLRGPHGFLDTLDAERQQLNQRDLSPQAELQALLEDAEAFPPGSEAWASVHAALGRNALQDKDWLAASEAYSTLLDHPDLFPEAKLGLEQARRGHLEAARQALKQRAYDQAAGLSRSFLEHKQHKAGPEEVRSASLLCALSCLGMQDFAAARPVLRQTWQAFRQAGPQPAQALGEACGDAITDAAHFWATYQALGSLDLPASDLEEARQALAGGFSRLYQMQLSSDSVPTLTPIILEIGSGLIPENVDTSIWPLFTTLIPAFRQRIEQEMGILVSGVRVRGNNALRPDEYTIQIMEVPAGRGSVWLRGLFCLADRAVLSAAGVDTASAIEDQEPLTHTTGCWLEPPQAESASQAGFEVLSAPDAFIINHLEAAVRARLSQFLGVQEVDALLFKWESAPGCADLLKSLTPNPAARFRLARLLRSLASQRISLANPLPVLQAALAGGLPDVSPEQTLPAARLALKARLPGNLRPEKRCPLPPAIEQQLAAPAGLDPQGAHRLSQDLQDWLQTLPDDAVLVASNPAALPLLHRLGMHGFPDMTLMTVAEIAPSGVPELPSDNPNSVIQAVEAAAATKPPNMVKGAAE